jgi:hypothetical protein
MITRAYALTALDEYLDRHADDLQNGFTRKFHSRAKIIDDPERPGCIVFEIERHRGILGSCYKPGVPLSSFITYWPRYVFDPKTKTLVHLGVIRKSLWTFGASADCEVGSLLFRFSKNETGRVQVIEKGSNISATVSHVGEAENFAAGIVGNWNLDRYASEAADVLAPEQPQEYMAAVRRELEAAARRRLTDYWELLLQPSLS